MRDAELFEEYEEWLQKLVRIIDPLLDAPPLELRKPKNVADAMMQYRTLAKVAYEVVRLGKNIPAFYELLTAPAHKMLNR
jgi:hypothetical protein